MSQSDTDVRERLGQRVLNCLRRNATTLEQAGSMSDADLLALRNFGKASLRELREAFDYEPPPPPTLEETMAAILDEQRATKIILRTIRSEVAALEKRGSAIPPHSHSHVQEHTHPYLEDDLRRHQHPVPHHTHQIPEHAHQFEIVKGSLDPMREIFKHEYARNYQYASALLYQACEAINRRHPDPEVTELLAYIRRAFTSFAGELT